MKQLGAKLKNASGRFSEMKHRMTREHKQEVFERIKEIRASHDRFWAGGTRRSNAPRRTGRTQGAVCGSCPNQHPRQLRAASQGGSGGGTGPSNLRSNLEKLSDARSESYAERVRAGREDESRLEESSVASSASAAGSPRTKASCAEPRGALAARPLAGTGGGSCWGSFTARISGPANPRSRRRDGLGFDGIDVGEGEGERASGVCRRERRAQARLCEATAAWAKSRGTLGRQVA